MSLTEVIVLLVAVIIGTYFGQYELIPTFFMGGIITVYINKKFKDQRLSKMLQAGYWFLFYLFSKSIIYGYFIKK